jgi:hypothetical protein
MVRRMPTSPGVSDVVLVSDAVLLDNLKMTFAPELVVLGDAAREQLDAMDTVASWEAWERMRRTSGLQVRLAKKVMAHMLAALCADSADLEAERPSVIGLP